jgi:hypothetical protein
MTRNGDSEAEMARMCSILESIAKQYPPDSDEALAIRDAALAYIAVRQHKAMQRSYDKLRTAFGGSHGEVVKADLRRHGIDPDELESEESPE